MNIELLLDNKNGNVFDISDLVNEVTWKTKRKGSPSSLNFKLLEDTQVKIDNGDVLSFKADENKVFYGYVFDNGGNKEPEISVIAYDQIRYLMFNDTYAAVNKKASEITSQIFQDVGLNIGIIEDTGFVIPKFLEDDKKILDIIYSSLEKNLLATGNTYVLYDDFGSLNLKNINNMKQEAVISDDNNLGDYDWKNSIDNDTYNRIKLVRDNEETKQRDVYLVYDSNSIAKWGRLQYFQKVDENLNKAQIEEMLNNTLKIKNRESKTLKLKDVIGTDISADLKLRAGAGVYVEIKKKNISQYYLIEEATHKFSKGQHIMDFELKVV
jgi:hypothetical protein